MRDGERLRIRRSIAVVLDGYRDIFCGHGPSRSRIVLFEFAVIDIQPTNRPMRAPACHNNRAMTWTLERTCTLAVSRAFIGALWVDVRSAIVSSGRY